MGNAFCYFYSGIRNNFKLVNLNARGFREVISLYLMCSVFDYSEAVFQCLDVLLKLNHSLLEPHLEAIWVMLWKTGSSKRVVHGTLMFSLTSTYVKLRQVSAVEIKLSKCLGRIID